MQKPSPYPWRTGGEQGGGWKKFLRVALPAAGIVVLVALLADVAALRHRRPVPRDTTSDLRNIVLQPAGKRYVDASGLFSIVPPPGWKTVVRPEGTSYRVAFYGPNGTDLSISATPVRYDNLSELLAEIKATEKQFGIATDEEPFFLEGRPAVRRTVSLHQVKVLAIDFVEDRVAHHIEFACPHEFFDRYRPVVMEVIGTYRAGKPAKKKKAAAAP